MKNRQKVLEGFQGSVFRPNERIIGAIEIKQELIRWKFSSRDAPMQIS